MFENQSDIRFAIISISIVFLILALLITVIVLLHKRKIERLNLEKAIMIAEHEKASLRMQVEVHELASAALGKELHDNIGQLLNTAKMLIAVADRNANQPSDILKTADETLATAIREIRLLARSLDKDWLEQFSFTENLNTAISRNNSGNNITASFIKNAEINLPAGEQLILFRIVQEAMQNAIKHAAPTGIIVTSEKKNDHLLISISDNGTGFSPRHTIKGMGLTNMKHRTKLLGGDICWQAALPQGTTVTISLPSKPTQA